MLFALGHGQHVVETDTAAGPPAAAIDAAPLAAVAPAVAAEAVVRELEPAGAGGIAALEDRPSVARPSPRESKFRYFFPDAPGLTEAADVPKKLDDLANSMVLADTDPLQMNAAIPAVFTYLGQFIDHDITANTDRDDPEKELSIIEGAITPLPRPKVTQKLRNLRNGALELDSVYGDAPDQDAFSRKLAGLMRDRAKMRLSAPAPVGERVPLPADNQSDLLRLGALITEGKITLAELQALPAELKSVFIDSTSNEPILARAIVGDSRNDENLIVAQLQVLFLRLHNALVDATNGNFDQARRLTRYHYQWLVANVFLPNICSPGVVAEVMDSKAKLYTEFFKRHGKAGSPKMPMPLEFSVAGFRYGHTMVRDGYDFNRRFGEQVPSDPGDNRPGASLGLIFGFTGDGRMLGDPTAGQLPQRWVIEWERFIRTDSTRPRRAARKIDSNLAPTLGKLPNPPAGVFKHLAQRNLRRGYRLNLPTAQACIAGIEAAGCGKLQVLTPEQLASGSNEMRDAVKDIFDKETPLWFYVLKEAEVLGGGERLGPLGSHIVANTLLGLIINDEKSYWNDCKTPKVPWSPAEFRPKDPIDSLEDLVRFCGMIE